MQIRSPVLYARDVNKDKYNLQNLNEYFMNQKQTIKIDTNIFLINNRKTIKGT